jgi:hypothetical protein
MGEKHTGDEELDRQVEDSFPASDPPSFTPAKTGGRTDTSRTDPPQTADADELKPKGSPSSDRHEAETTAGRIAGKDPPEHHH